MQKEDLFFTVHYYIYAVLFLGKHLIAGFQDYCQYHLNNINQKRFAIGPFFSYKIPCFTLRFIGAQISNLIVSNVE